MILEGVITTRHADGRPHLAPMGPRVDADITTLVIRPFHTSTTGQNLLRDRQGVFHLTDDVRLIARAAVGGLEAMPAFMPAVAVDGFVLADCCRWFEFRITDVDTSAERMTLTADVIHAGRGREFVGFNRARHAVVEAAVLATRFHLLPLGEVAAEFAKLRVIVDKTGGPAEDEAMALLEARLAAVRSTG